MNQITCNFQFPPYSRILVCGPSTSGKSQWIKNLLNNSVFKRRIDHVIFFYNVWSTSFEDLKIASIEFIQGINSLSEVLQRPRDFFQTRKTIICFEDLDFEIFNSSLAADVFKVYAHNLPLEAVVMTSQNLFSPQRFQVSIQRNISHFVLTKSLRMGNILMSLGRNFFPNKPIIISNAYNLAINEPNEEFPYLIFFADARKEEDFFYSGIFSGEKLRVFLPKKKILNLESP